MFDWRPPEMNLWSLASIDYEAIRLGGGYSQDLGSKSQDVIAASVARDGVFPLAAGCS
jgi:hypothetical protein